jgi:hypothetical protein
MLLGGRSPDFRRLCRSQNTYSRRLPALCLEQWPVAAFVPVTVAGAAPAFHRLPSPTNKRLRLFQKKKSLSSSGSPWGGPRAKHYRETNPYSEPNRLILVALGYAGKFCAGGAAIRSHA